MTDRAARIARLTQNHQNQPWHACYLGFFDCFNQGRFYEAHEVLEELWLQERHGPEDAFYKGLIQLAGAFVHWQKRRCAPAMALLRLARGNLQGYRAPHQGLELNAILDLIDQSQCSLAAGAKAGRTAPGPPQPHLPVPCTKPGACDIISG